MAVSVIRCAATAPKVVSSSKKSTTVRSHSGKASSSSASASASKSAAFLASALLVAAPSSARASELTEKLAGFFDAVDAASETVASGVSANRGSGEASERGVRRSSSGGDAVRGTRVCKRRNR